MVESVKKVGPSGVRGAGDTPAATGSPLMGAKVIAGKVRKARTRGDCNARPDRTSSLAGASVMQDGSASGS